MQGLLAKFTEAYSDLWPSRPEKSNWSDETMVLAKLLDVREQEIDGLRQDVARLQRAVSRMDRDRHPE